MPPQQRDTASRATGIPDPLRIAVGETYDSGVRRWPGHELVLTTQGCILLLDYTAPTTAQIHQFLTAEAQFAWINARHNGILCYRFGAAPWRMLPSNPHRDTPPGTTAGVPNVAAGQHLPVSIGLSDADAPVLALRTVQWPEHFAGAIGVTVRRLRAQPFDAERTYHESNWLYGHVGAEKLAQRASSWARINPRRDRRSSPAEAIG